MTCPRCGSNIKELSKYGDTTRVRCDGSMDMACDWHSSVVDRPLTPVAPVVHEQRWVAEPPLAVPDHLSPPATAPTHLSSLQWGGNLWRWDCFLGLSGKWALRDCVDMQWVSEDNQCCNICMERYLSPKRPPSPNEVAEASLVGVSDASWATTDRLFADDAEAPKHVDRVLYANQDDPSQNGVYERAELKCTCTPVYNQYGIRGHRSDPQCKMHGIAATRPEPKPEPVGVVASGHIRLGDMVHLVGDETVAAVSPAERHCSTCSLRHTPDASKCCNCLYPEYSAWTDEALEPESDDSLRGRAVDECVRVGYPPPPGSIIMLAVGKELDRMAATIDITRRGTQK